MGVLDDAIREHLDLKRRHGADPAEIERAEREALGPVRRGPEEPEPFDGEPADRGGYDHDDNEPDWDQPFDHQADPFEPSGGERGIFDVEDSRAERDHESAEPDDPDDRAPSRPTRDDEDDEPQSRRRSRLPFRRDRREPTRDETVEYHLDDELSGEDHHDGDPKKPKRDDPLEETPEFLQDAPDHDQLWFEQRPPRDFDFDG
jgi:hypothetical protein